MSDITIYHNPRCSKSRKALEILQEHNLDIEIIEYLRTPPSLKTPQAIRDALDGELQEMVRVKEQEYREAGLSQDSSEQDILEAIAKFPKLLERPIIVRGTQAVIARPPEKVNDLL